MEEIIARLKESWADHRGKWLLALAGIGLVLGYYFLRQPTTTTTATNDLAASTSQVSSAVATSSTPTSTSGKVTVDVKGAVHRPGVYTLSRSSRVQEAVKRAGGETAEADMRQVNLAKQLVDQQVVYIPVVGEELPAGSMAEAITTTGSATSGTSDQEKINLNTATKEDLMKISGIGEKKAEQIIAYRQTNGQFKTVEDLQNVDGFGEKTVAKIKDQVAV